MPYDYTLVSVEKSQADIKGLLARMDAQAFRFTSLPSYALLEFVRKVDNGQFIPYRIKVQPKTYPDAKDTFKARDRAERQVWRVVYYWLKSKLEAVEFGLLEFEQEFLPYMLLSDGQGKSETVDKLFFERLAGRLGPRTDDPFEGLRPALPEGGKP